MLAQRKGVDKMKEFENKTESIDPIEQISAMISGWTKDSGTMLPKSTEEIKQYISNGNSLFVKNGHGEIAGFAAITFDWPDGWKELGAVIVDPEKRENGFGHKVVKNLINMAVTNFPDSKFFALCNNKSLKLFLDNGAEIIKDPNLLPPEVFGECVNCPHFQEAKSQGKVCCDTPVTIK